MSHAQTFQFEECGSLIICIFKKHPPPQMILMMG